MGSTLVDVQFLELIDVGQDFIELAAVGVDLSGGEFEVRQLGYAYHFFAADFHCFSVWAPLSCSVE